MGPQVSGPHLQSAHVVLNGSQHSVYWQSHRAPQILQTCGWLHGVSYSGMAGLRILK
jgi:hypothetical protein